MGFSEVIGTSDLAVFLGLLILVITVLAVVRYLRRQ
jgi:hypothetical protein